ncbi:MAG: efflux transporter outer membrane subunit [Telluria sp.]
MFKPLILTALAAALAGCTTVGPNFKEPAAPQQASYRHGASAPAAQMPAQWWSVFHDSALDALEQRALRDNPGVKASAQRLVQAQAQLGAANSSLLPAVGVGTSVSNSRTSARTSQGLALGGRSIEGNNYAVGASFSYELDLWGRVHRVVEGAQAQELAAKDERDGVMLLLSAQVAQTYWQLRGLDTEQDILQRALATRRESQQLIEARFNGGLSNELDVSRARIERANAEADLHDVQRQRNALEHALAVLVGASPSEPLLATTADKALPLPPSVPVGLPATLLAQRPDLAASVAGLRALNAQVGVAEAAFYPSLSLTGNFGYASEALRDITDHRSRQYSIGPLALNLPILDGGRNRANLTLSKARYEEAVANHEARLLTALREVEDALSDVQERQAQADAQANAQIAAARARAVAQARFDRGLSTYLDVTDAQRSELAADRAAAQIRTQRLLAAVAVARSLGGGWTAGAYDTTAAR